MKQKFVSIEKGKNIIWGICPFPAGLEPILADAGFGSPTYGILFRSKGNPNLFANGRAGVIKNIHPDVAKALINDFEKTLEKGKNYFEISYVADNDTRNHGWDICLAPNEDIALKFAEKYLAPFCGEYCYPIITKKGKVEDFTQYGMNENFIRNLAIKTLSTETKIQQNEYAKKIEEEQRYNTETTRPQEQSRKQRPKPTKPRRTIERIARPRQNFLDNKPDITFEVEPEKQLKKEETKTVSSFKKKGLER